MEGVLWWADPGGGPLEGDQRSWAPEEGSREVSWKGFTGWCSPEEVFRRGTLRMFPETDIL